MVGELEIGVFIERSDIHLLNDVDMCAVTKFGWVSWSYKFGDVGRPEDSTLTTAESHDDGVELGLVLSGNAELGSTSSLATVESHNDGVKLRPAGSSSTSVSSSSLLSRDSPISGSHLSRNSSGRGQACQEICFPQPGSLFPEPS